jgi:hypothetical protein
MKSNINEIPVTISAFIIGIWVTDIIIFLENLRLIAFIPTAAAVPKTVEIIAEETAIITVCFNALSIAVSLPRPSYQRVENPSNTQTLEEELKENTTITAIGA